MDRLFLLDAYALIYRSYFAFINAPRINSKGLNTSAMLGFVNTLEMIFRLENPSHVAVAFDMKGPTFRHEAFENYKSQRESMPEDIRTSIPWIRSIISAYNIPIIEREGFEADDVIGTLAKEYEKKGFQVYMVTPDKDYGQLVSENIFIYKPNRMGNGIEKLGLKEICEKYKIKNPLQVIDILGLMGDASDNIPGCQGIGPVTAEKLVGEFGSVEGIYQNIDKIKGKVKENLLRCEKIVRLSRHLAEIILNVPLEYEPEDLVRKEPNAAELSNIFNELEFRALAARVLGNNLEKAAPVASKTEQGTLFSFQEQVSQQTAEKNTHESIHSTEHLYHLVNTPESRSKLIGDLKKVSALAFDTETSGIDPNLDEMVGISFAYKKGEAWYIPVPADPIEACSIVNGFKEIFENEKILKIGQNMKFDILLLSKYGIEVRGDYFDTMVAHYLIQPELSHNLDYLSEIYLGYKKVPTGELIGRWGKSQLSMRTVELEKIKEYACEDADITLQLKSILESGMQKSGVEKLFREVEMPLLKVLISMEQEGQKIDVKALEDYAVVLKDQINKLEMEITVLAGESFNISSPRQLGYILFEKLQLDPKAKRTKTKQYSTGEDVLLNLTDRHPIIPKILEHRGLKKLLSTYVESLPKMINPETGKIHSSFNQTIAATGRLSSTNPNLQNIPIRDENGREIRKAFIPSSENHLFLAADYSQIELRIMAALSGDKVMTEAFTKDEDIHAATASKIFNVPLEEVTSDMRRKAKTANFGILYGISAFGLSQRLNIPRSEAKQIIDDYFANFADIKEYMDKQLILARRRGYVETILGRRRYISDINSANASVRGFAERNAINAPIQGSAADIIKVAMVKIAARFHEEGITSKLILQVHDELDFDVYKPELEKVKNIVKHEMENAVHLSVPIVVEMNAASNWLEAH